MQNTLEVIWSPESLKHLGEIRKLKSKDEVEQYVAKIILLIEDIKKSPFKGLGKPEHLKNKLPPCWSRRINHKDRLIYRIKNKEIEIISIIGHYK